MSVALTFLSEIQIELLAAEHQAGKLREHRDMLIQNAWAQGYSQTDLAKRVGLSRERVGQIIAPIRR